MFQQQTSLIQAGLKDGFWIYLANCHLLSSWMPQLEQIVKTIEDNGKLTHPDFRLWLSSKPYATFPTTLLENSIKVSTEESKVGPASSFKRP